MKKIILMDPNYDRPYSAAETIQKIVKENARVSYPEKITEDFNSENVLWHMNEALTEKIQNLHYKYNLYENIEETKEYFSEKESLRKKYLEKYKLSFQNEKFDFLLFSAKFLLKEKLDLEKIKKKIGNKGCKIIIMSSENNYLEKVKEKFPTLIDKTFLGVRSRLSAEEENRINDYIKMN